MTSYYEVLDKIADAKSAMSKMGDRRAKAKDTLQDIAETLRTMELHLGAIASHLREQRFTCNGIAETLRTMELRYEQMDHDDRRLTDVAQFLRARANLLTETNLPEFKYAAQSLEDAASAIERTTPRECADAPAPRRPQQASATPAGHASLSSARPAEK